MPELQNMSSNLKNPLLCGFCFERLAWLAGPPLPASISYFQKGSYQDYGRFLKTMFLSIFPQAFPPMLSPHDSLLIQHTDSYLRVNMNYW